MRILHLAYEDFRAPGSGGGAVRTREIGRRLAARHQITAVVTGYPGARPRVEDGVRWVPVGSSLGGRAARLRYFAALRHQVLRSPHDLVVEDFGAPFSAGFAPLYTRRPVVASVQWLFAEEMRRKYRLPFDWVERRALPLYQRFVVMSRWLGDEVRERAPGARIACIANGVDDEAFTTRPAPPQHFLFVGRLDVVQKGVDLLLEAYADARRRCDGLPPLLLAGDGPDEARVRRDVAHRGLTPDVRLLGRVDGPEKYELMASAYAVLMPSRWESFGIVAAEAMAVGVPLVAFDVGPLGEVCGEHAVLVEPFDVERYAGEIVAAAASGGDRQSAGARKRWAHRFDWDAIADEQEAVYEAALAEAPA